MQVVWLPWKMTPQSNCGIGKPTKATNPGPASLLMRHITEGLEDTEQHEILVWKKEKKNTPIYISVTVWLAKDINSQWFRQRDIANSTFLQILAQQRSFKSNQDCVKFRPKKWRKWFQLLIKKKNAYPLRYILQRPI